MTGEERTIPAFHPSADLTGVLAQARRQAPGLVTGEYEILYYPYLHFEFRVETRVFGRTSRGTAFCLVSLVDGREGLTTAIPPWRQVTVAATQVLPERVTADEARRRARSYILYPVLKKNRTLQVPVVTVVREERVFRPFYLVSCRRAREDGRCLPVPFALLVDGLSGRFQLVETEPESGAQAGTGVGQP